MEYQNVIRYQDVVGQPKISSVKGDGQIRPVQERAAQGILTLCACFAVLTVIAITGYMLQSGLPALQKIGLHGLLLETRWQPTAQVPRFGILYVVMTSVIGTAAAILLGVPIGVLTAVFLAETAPKGLAGATRAAVELLAGIPSVIYGLLGVMLLNPLMYQLEQYLFRDSETHQFTGGANLLSAVLVLAIMILPTVITVSESALRAVPDSLRWASYALGADKMQTIFQTVLPAARSGIVTAVILGTGRAIGEAMAISLVSGSSVNAPFPFCSVRFLTTAIVSEMGYASGLHREVLFAIALILFAFIMLIDLALARFLKKERK